MCTIGRTSAGMSRKVNNKPYEARIPAGNGQKRDDNGTKRGRCHFLTACVSPVAKAHLKVEYYGEQYEVITQDNYEFLRDSYLRYAKLANVEPSHTPGKSLGESISRLYDDMAAIIGDENNLNIEQNHGRLYFNLWRYHTWGKYTLYYFPVCFIERLDAMLRKLAITFLNNLIHANGISVIHNDDDVDCVLTWIEEEDSGDESPQEQKRRKALINSYRDGRIARMLDRIWKKSYYKNLPAAFDRYAPKNDFEKLLIAIMKDGLEFLTPEKGIMQYSYDPFRQEEPDRWPIELERQIRVVYDIDDSISDALVEFYNCEHQETYEIAPVETLALSPETEALFSIRDNYPERFFKWADRFINTVT